MPSRYSNPDFRILWRLVRESAFFGRIYGASPQQDQRLVAAALFYCEFSLRMQGFDKKAVFW